MTAAELLQQLATYQDEAVAICRSAGPAYRQQFHPDISPVGWHLGHCIFTESYWIHEMFLADRACEDSLHELYNPLHTSKENRGQALPAVVALIDWAQETQAGNRHALQKYSEHRDAMQLMENNFLLHFLIQHYAQHLETMQMALAQATKQHNSKAETIKPLHSHTDSLETVPIPAGEYDVGGSGNHLPYDNEYPSHTVQLPGCHIMKNPVNNGTYLRFMECGGYENKEHWSTEGWRWQQDNHITHPAYWRRDKRGQWSAVDHRGPVSLEPLSPVSGLGYYEAEACATWAGGRLPHEHEWETACINGLLQKRGLVWEWCHNSFFPYAGFRAYPYEGYSVPYFDGEHFTLKGGSILTRPVIKRSGFRNYYQADKNFLFAGIRLAFDEPAGNRQIQIHTTG